MTKPVLFVTNHAPPFRVGAFQALDERQHVVFALIGGNVRHGGGGTAVEEADAVRRRAPGAARRRAPRRLGPLQGRDRRDVGQGRAPRRLRRRARRPDPVRPVGDDLGPPAHPGARALLPPAAPHLPPRGRDRHLRPARLRLRQDQAPAGPGVRGAAGRRRRASGRPRRPPSATATSRSCSPGAPCPRRASTCCDAPPTSARSWSPTTAARPISATSTRAATLWSYRRFPRAISSSRGGWSSTKPSIREFP